MSTSEGVAVVIGVGIGLGLLSVEYCIATAKGQPVYRFRDSMANISCGVIHQIASLYYSSFVFPAYELLRQRCGMLNIEFSVASAVSLLVLIDFLFYWEHRLLHTNRVLWAAHVVHHQSDEFNITVALRVSVLQIWMTMASTLVLAVAGFPPGMALAMLLVYKFYQLWTHTRVIGRLGPLEWVLVTPSHHRVHHARNERYVDKNFGGMLIIWDRLFGTFEPECESPCFGVTNHPVTFNPVLANLGPWLALRGQDATAVPQGVTPGRLSRWQAVSALLRFVAVLGLTIALLVGQTGGTGAWLLTVPVSVVWLWQLGAVLDARGVTRRSDTASLVVALTTAAALALLGANAGIIGALLAGTLLVAVASGCEIAQDRRAGTTLLARAAETR
jgi:sterol desaturase/sphingolipid hydroxylase (fatty acid hydroxylase superfamily)